MIDHDHCHCQYVIIGGTLQSLWGRPQLQGTENQPDGDGDGVHDSYGRGVHDGDGYGVHDGDDRGVHDGDWWPLVNDKLMYVL